MLVGRVDAAFTITAHVAESPLDVVAVIVA